MKAALYLCMIFLLLCNNLILSQSKSKNCFEYLKSEEYIKAIEILKTCAFEELQKNNYSSQLDSLYILSKSFPSRSKYKYVLGKVMAELNYNYNAYIYLTEYLKHEKEGSFAADAALIIDTLKIDKTMLEYFNYWQMYQEELFTGGIEAGKKYWDEKTLSAFSFYDNNQYFWNYLKNKNIPHMNYIKSITAFPGYVKLTATDRYGENVLYFIKDKEIKLTAPAILFVKGGKRHETPEFDFYCTPDENLPDTETVNLLTDNYYKICGIFNVKIPEKIKYFMCGDRQQVGEFLNLPEAGGYAQTENNTIIACRWNMIHELTHIISIRKYPGVEVNALLEGTAFCFGGSADCDKDAYLPHVKALCKIKKLPSVDAMLNDSVFFSTGANEAYLTMGAFVNFLIEKYGIEKFVAFYSKVKAETETRAALVSVFGKTAAELETGFKEWLDNLNEVTIKPCFNRDGNVIFEMDDPAGDDYGDGNYIYPADPKVKKGMYDITRFRVLTDKEYVYFEIKLKEMSDYNLGEWGCYRTMVNISIKKDSSQNKNITELCWDLNAKAQQQDMWIEVSDIGAMLWDYKYKSIKAFTLINTYKTKFADTSDKCIRFGIPISIIGKPEAHWGYIVGVAGRDTAGCGFESSYGNGAGVIMKIASKESPNTGGGGTDTEYNCNYYDLLLPPEYSQKDLLKNYNPGKKEKPILPYIYKK